MDLWIQKRIDLFTKLLINIANYLGYSFDELKVRDGIYAPRGHAQVETEQEIIRRGLVKVFSGETAFPMDVRSFPYDQKVADEQAKTLQLMSKWLGGQLKVRIETETINGPETARYAKGGSAD